MAQNSSYEVVDDVLTWHTKRGGAIVVDLDIPADVLQSALGGDSDEDQDEEAQIRSVLGWLGQDSLDAFEQMGILERNRFMRAFFDEFAKAVQLSMGESVSSSSSDESTEMSSGSTSAASSDSPSTGTSDGKSRTPKRTG